MNIFSPQRPARTTPAHEQAVRLRIVDQLNEKIKMVLHEFSDSDELISNCESTNELCHALEALFIHGLRDSFLELFSSALHDSRRPEPDFWAPLLVVSHRALLAQLGGLSQIRTDIGKCRAWLRAALNDGLLTSYLAAISGDRRLLGYHYEKYALLRNRDQMDIVSRYLQGLEVLRLRLAVNSSLLNTWDEAPLELAGVYFRPRLASQAGSGAVARGTDVAASIVEPPPRRLPPPGQLLPIPTPSGNTLIMNALDPDLAFDVIMRTSSVDDLGAMGGSPARPVPLESGCSSEASSLAGEVAQLTARPPPPPPPEQSYINVLESYRDNSPRARSLMQTPDVQFIFGKSVGSSDCSSAGGDSACSSPAPAAEPDTSGPPQQTQPAVIEAGESLPVNDQPDKAAASGRSSPERDPRQRWLSEIATERGLDGQDYTCAGCARFVGMLYGQPRICRFDSLFYCSDCHTGQDSMPLPARVVNNWDFMRYPVAVKNREYLESVDLQPLINVSATNPNIYDVSADMERARLQRTRLVFLSAFLKTCRSGASAELSARLAGRQHLSEHVHLYAAVDLRDVKIGSLGQTLQLLVDFAQGHVLACSLCSQKGFVCEFCRDSRIIYPFELETTRQCRHCFGLYHSRCWPLSVPCPRCERYRRRDQLRRLLEEPEPLMPLGAGSGAPQQVESLAQHESELTQGAVAQAPQESEPGIPQAIECLASQESRLPQDAESRVPQEVEPRLLQDSEPRLLQEQGSSQQQPGLQRNSCVPGAMNYR